MFNRNTSISPFLIIAIFCIFVNDLQAQSTLVAPFTSAANRARLHRNLVNNSINKNLSLPLNDSTTDYWEDAFYSLQLLNYKNSFVEGKVLRALDYFPNAQTGFQRAFLELLYANYKGKYTREISFHLKDIDNIKVFAMAVEYLLADTNRVANRDSLSVLIRNKFPDDVSSHPILMMLSKNLENKKPALTEQMVTDMLSSKFLAGYPVLYSFQRKNRDYPGMAIIRDASGKYVTTDTNKIFNVPHFGRSLSALPSYITNGNTPQGIFKMYGFAVSSSQFIGPSVNIQMCMPVECTIQKFRNDTLITDSIWNENFYKVMLPASLQNYIPIYDAYYAGAAGRTEIIAHGTTVDPKYYTGKIYYPHTPSLGCLTTSEIWDDNGRRIASNQHKLVDALLKAGGAYGYVVVLELPGEGAIDLSEIKPYLP